MTINTQLFACTGKNICIQEPCLIDYPEGLHLGDNIHIGRGTEMQAAGGIHIGNNVVIAYQCVLWTVDHRYEGELLPYDYARIRKPIHIEDNVWIGRNVIIRGGVTIGEGAVVAMGSVVTRDIPPLAVVGGNPAKILKYRDKKVYQTHKEQGHSLWTEDGRCGACYGEKFYFVEQTKPTSKSLYQKMKRLLFR
ncbi:acyltransferase [Candidatus Albibeggiatoa sp. nov. NOAA]|uniref:acyltransferase n=1 Tax=Candidatus Albibeggiatoa sp. nov. NOAA TaxID=3162724 RepID=UPI0032F2F1E4|nr:acyltransferase [Thiotrichaceae bacterium]